MLSCWRRGQGWLPSQPGASEVLCAAPGEAVAVRGATLDRSTLGGTEASFRFKTRDRPFQYLVRDWYTYALESTQTSKLEGSKAPNDLSTVMAQCPMDQCY